MEKEFDELNLKKGESEDAKNEKNIPKLERKMSSKNFMI